MAILEERSTYMSTGKIIITILCISFTPYLPLELLDL
jgi:hypothetical protein